MYYDFVKAKSSIRKMRSTDRGRGENDMKRKEIRPVISGLIAMLLVVTLAAPALAATATLKVGSTGSAVRSVQEQLIMRGYLDDNADGVYGAKTKAAVVAFQKDQNLTADGICGAATQNALAGADRSLRTIPADVMWLARLISAEAKGEPYRGQLAVGNVIMNPGKSSEFPNTVYGVIFQYTNGVPQFSPVADGSIWNQPTISSIRAAWASYRGQKTVASCLYFFNPTKVPVNWISKNRTYYTTIGSHAFYR